MDWAKESASWPHAAVSQFVDLAGARWHLQQMGEGPDLLLLHGSGATTHSFADMMPLLAQDFRVTALDLPGHGFTSALSSSQPTLQGVSQAIAALLAHQDVHPKLVVGHSAGAAIAVKMAIHGHVAPAAMVSINGAFYPFPGLASTMFPAIAKMLFLNPFVPRIFASSASSRRRVDALIDSTGSKLTQAQVDLYQRALTSSAHVEGTLAMMANWDLVPLESYLKDIDLPVLQIIGAKDKTIRPSAAQKTASLLKQGQLVEYKDEGHLVHEERPADVAQTIKAFAVESGFR